MPEQTRLNKARRAVMRVLDQFVVRDCNIVMGMSRVTRRPPVHHVSMTATPLEFGSLLRDMYIS